MELGVGVYSEIKTRTYIKILMYGKIVKKDILMWDNNIELGSLAEKY